MINFARKTEVIICSKLGLGVVGRPVDMYSPWVPAILGNACALPHHTGEVLPLGVGCMRGGSMGSGLPTHAGSCHRIWASYGQHLTTSPGSLRGWNERHWRFYLAPVTIYKTRRLHPVGYVPLFTYCKHIMIMPCSWPRDQSLDVVAIFSRK